MKEILKLKPRPKKHKPTAISNYKVSYLDKRSKTYHRIVMTAFSGLFGLVGLVYVFGSSAASNQDAGIANSDSTLYVLVALASLFLLLLAAFIALGPRKK